MGIRPFSNHESSEGAPGKLDPETLERLDLARRRMIEVDLEGRGIRDQHVLHAMAHVPRHRFVSRELIENAYDDTPLDIGCGQTISQPYIVAKMTELLEVRRGDRVLEIGAGCGYQTAILLELGVFVYCVEIMPELAAALAERLAGLGYKNFMVSQHDGRFGWPDFAPFDAILLAAAPVELPRLLLEQVHIGGRVVAPVGNAAEQILMRWTLKPRGWEREEFFSVRFVPMLAAES